MLLFIPLLMDPLIFLWLYLFFRLSACPNKRMVGVLSSPFMLVFTYVRSNPEFLVREFLFRSSLAIFLATIVQSPNQYSTWCWPNCDPNCGIYFLKTHSRTSVTSPTEPSWFTQFPRSQKGYSDRRNEDFYIFPYEGSWLHPNTISLILERQGILFITLCCCACKFFCPCRGYRWCHIVNFVRYGTIILGLLL
jgi:hypothetical protein